MSKADRKAERAAEEAAEKAREELRSTAEKAVAGFQEAQDALTEFLSDEGVREVLMEMEDLVSDHNTKLDAAVRAVKSCLKKMNQDKLVIEGIGAQKKYKRYYDVDFLAKSLPADQADEVLTEKIVYELDIERLEQMQRQGEIDNRLVRMAFHEEELNPASLPGTPKAFTLPALPVLE